MLLLLLPLSLIGSPLLIGHTLVWPRHTLSAAAAESFGIDFFGAALALLGNSTVAVGCPRAAGGGYQRGAVYLLALDASGGVDHAWFRARHRETPPTMARRLQRSMLTAMARWS
jgi:hypothetical protein